PTYAAEREKSFGAESFTLDNGLQVVLIPNHRAPVIAHMVWYKTGAIDEPHGQSGVAHFVEHLMFKGSEKIPPGEFSKMVSAMGGNDNAFTSQDYTAYHESVANDRLKDVMEMEADRMIGLTFPSDHVLSERKVVMEERRERTDNDPRAYFGEQMRAALFVNHPYGNPVVGWLQELDALERENVKYFYEQHYAPNNAVVVVSGDVTMKELKPLAEKIYGPIPRRGVAERKWTEVPPLLANTRLVLHHPSVRQPVLSRVYRVPSYVQNKEESLALQVLESILDGGAAARLYKTLVVDQHMASSVDFSYQADALSDGTVNIGMVPADDVGPEELEWAFDSVLRTLITDGVTEDELRRAKDRMKDDAIFARDSLMGPAMIFGQALATGETIDDVEFWPENIEKITIQQVNDVAKKYLNPDDYGTRPFVTGYLLPPAPKEEPEPAPEGMAP
ncbi:MAG TPA: pitrilysin family protein, partial [Alphaproteobacteria bacterium]